MNSKLFAIMATIVMVVATGAIALNAVDADNEQLTAYEGKINVYVYNELDANPGWDMTIVQGYDAFKAIESEFSINPTISSLDTTTTYNPNADDVYNDSQTITIRSYGYDYMYPNPEYGDFDSFNDIDNDGDYIWHVYVYDSSNGWRTTNVTLGWLKPFDDYAEVVDSQTNGKTCGVANIAFVYGDTTSMHNIASYATGDYAPRALTDTSGADYKYYFELTSTVLPTVASVSVTQLIGNVESSHTLTASDIVAGIIIVGHGSDAFLALRNAIGANSNESVQLVAPYVWNSNTYTYDYYSWYYNMFGLSDYYDSVNSTWHFWESQFNNNGTPDWCSFSLGYYSNYSGGYNDQSDHYYLTYH